MPDPRQARYLPDDRYCTRAPGVRVIPFGYGASQQEVHAVMADLISRPAFGNVAKTPGDCVVGFYHQFYNSPFDVVAREFLGRLMYPEESGALDPDKTYRSIIRRYTDIPDEPFLFGMRRSYTGDAEPCTGQ